MIETISARATLKRLQTPMPYPGKNIIVVRVDPPNVTGFTLLAFKGARTPLFKFWFLVA
jgi:hypothetical protein